MNDTCTANAGKSCLSRSEYAFQTVRDLIAISVLTPANIITCTNLTVPALTGPNRGISAVSECTMNRRSRKYIVARVHNEGPPIILGSARQGSSPDMNCGATRLEKSGIYVLASLSSAGPVDSAFAHPIRLSESWTRRISAFIPWL